MQNHLPGVPLTVGSIDELLAQASRRHPDKAAIIAVDPDTDNSQTIRYKELYSLVQRTRRLLQNVGITRGDRFAILMHNAPEVLIFELAGGLLGAATVPLDIKRDTLERKLYKLKDTGSRALFIKHEGQPDEKEIAALRKNCPSLTIVSWSHFSELKKMLDKLQKSADTKIRSAALLSSHYIILYTSGTTAYPKGVLLTARACILNALGIIQWQKFTSDDRFNIILPLHHINSTEFCLSMLLVGGTIILNSRYSASRFWDIVSRFRATNTSLVPTILHDLLVRYDEFAKQKLDISDFKRICIGSAPVLPVETLRFFETFGVRVVQGYGQTETALRVAGVPIDVTDTAYRDLVRSNTIGVELANNNLAIMDEQNNEKGETEHGEICIRGPVLADGYLNNPQETERVFIEGWFHSGDLGYWKYINGKKYYFIIGRIKEIIIKGGVNLSPSAIEDALLKTYEEIDEVSVVGYPDVRMGEEIAAVIVLKRPALASQGEALRNRITEDAQIGKISGISRYEAPKKVIVFDGLPKTSTGKIQRVEVKKTVAELMKHEKPKHYYIRSIDPREKKILRDAVAINNERWVGLPSSESEFHDRARNALLFGAFEENEGLVGTLSCIQLPFAAVEKLTTWNEATAHGILGNHDPHGDTLLCVAISVKSSKQQPASPNASQGGPTIFHRLSKEQEIELQRLARKRIRRYVTRDRDFVLNFHRKPKGGLPGAKVWKILENGRPEDADAMGYNVLMKYPRVSKGTSIIRSNAPTPSFLLIEHALIRASEQGLRYVIAFSRPAGFRHYLLTEKSASRSRP